MSVRQLTVPKPAIGRPGYVALVTALVAIWGVGDAVSTLWAIEATGSIHGEANPWIRTVLAYDPALLLLVKAAVVACAGGLLIRYRDFVESVPGWRIWFTAILSMGSAIVAANLYVGVSALA